MGDAVGEGVEYEPVWDWDGERGCLGVRPAVESST